MLREEESTGLAVLLREESITSVAVLYPGASFSIRASKQESDRTSSGHK